MEGIKTIPIIVLTIAIAGIITGAGIISTSKFEETMTDNGCYNSSYKAVSTAGICVCDNGTEAAFGNAGENNMSQEGYAACQATISQGDVAEQLPTVAIIAIMVIIISVIAGVFAYMRVFS